jgi:hypothetical protein
VKGYEELLEHFVASFEKLDEMTAVEEIDPVAWQLGIDGADEYGWKKWRPIKVKTPPSALEPIYAKLPARFPRLYEALVLSYRWAEVDLGTYRLLANPPGQDLSGLLNEMSNAPALWNALLPAGFVPFGKGPDIDYDQVCFDIKTRRHGGECRIVKIDHEEILCNNRVKVVAEVAPNFVQLVMATIERAGSSV